MIKTKFACFRFALATALAIFCSGLSPALAQINVACVGDSITAGYGLANPATQSYPAQLQTILGGGYAVGNYGNSGTTALKVSDNTYWNSWAYNNSTNFSPNIVVIMFGANDSKSWNWNAANFNSDYRALIAQYTNLPTHPKVFICYTPPMFLPTAFGTTFDPVFIENTVEPAIATIATQAGVQLIDNDTPLLNRPDLFQDGVHPTIPGAAIVAQQVYNAIKGVAPTNITTAAITSSGTPSIHGSPVTFTATLTSAAGTVTGAVVFAASNVLFSTNTLSGGMASVTNSLLPIGANVVAAQYVSQGKFLGNTHSLQQIVLDPTAPTLTDLGGSTPVPGPNDISQLSTSGDTTWPDGINYFSNNNPAVGQTFTTGTNALNLVSVALNTAELNPLFQNNAVLQCDARVPVWGSGREGEKITVAFAGQRISTIATNGVWKIWLKPMKPNARPQTLTVAGDTTSVVTNVLVGEVWVASGQSNMERQLGLRPGQQPISDWEKEAAAANYPQIRQFYVPQVKSFTPQTTVKGSWSVCAPDTVTNFTAVGYFFARDLFAARHVPVGIIHSSWGGTPAEAWTSETGLQKLPDFAESLAGLKKLTADPVLAERETQARQNAWYEKVDPGSKPESAWSAADLDTNGWKTMTLPTFWESAGYPDFDGVFWFRRKFDLPQNWDGGDVLVHLGAIDDNDTTWVNGTQIGATVGWSVPRVYRVPGRLLKPGQNVIAVRVLDTGGGGGMYGGGDAMRLLFNASGTANSLSLTGDWLCKQSVSLRITGWPPPDFSQDSSAPTVLYNGMIAPLLPYAIRGVIWYQGESNVGRERQYQKLFPAMIADWRQAWSQGDFPFLFVQIAPFSGMTPEIREAQLLSWQRTTNTAMAVTIDCGDANDIHPKHKQPVSARLALAARALAYGEKIEYSGPVYESLKIKGAKAVLHYKHLGGGLMAKDGELKGFTIASADKVFHPAQAKIVGETVVVNDTEVSRPVAVRYGWANVPEGNLFNRAGLPASPFRTD